MNPLCAFKEFVAGLSLGEPVHFRNMTVTPLFGPAHRHLDYTTFDDALAVGAAKITEISQSGTVPALCFKNAGDRPVFLCDGEELVGAKQNRVLNMSILAPAQATTVIPVSCVEAGRWHYRRSDFAAAKHTFYGRGRAMKAEQVSYSLAIGDGHRADQGAVWHDIAAKSARLGVHSETEAMAAMFDEHKTTLAEFAAAFCAQSHQSGAAFAINDVIHGVDAFDSPRTLARLLPKLVRGYALDAIDEDGHGTPGRAIDAKSFLGMVADADLAHFPAVGMGTDVRLTSAGAGGGALVVENVCVHLYAFARLGRTARDGWGRHRGIGPTPHCVR